MLGTEWQIVDIALQTYGKVGVSLYDTLGKDSVGTPSPPFHSLLKTLTFLARIYVMLSFLRV